MFMSLCSIKSAIYGTILHFFMYCVSTICNNIQMEVCFSRRIPQSIQIIISSPIHKYRKPFNCFILKVVVKNKMYKDVSVIVWARPVGLRAPALMAWLPWFVVD